MIVYSQELNLLVFTQKGLWGFTPVPREMLPGVFD